MNITKLKEDLVDRGFIYTEVEEWVTDKKEVIALVGYNHETRIDTEWMWFLSDELEEMGYTPYFSELSNMLYVE